MTEQSAREPAAKRALLARLLTERANAPRTFPVSFGQQRLWFLDRFQPGDPVYAVPVGFRVSGPLDLAALRAAVDRVVARHGALRTTFADAGGEPVAVVRTGVTAAFEVTELAGTPNPAQEATRLVWQEARRPFDLASGPLFRVRVLRVADDEHYLSFCLHHIICDAWSLGVLFRELNTAYAALRDGAEPELPTLPAQYADYTAWQRDRLSGAALRAQLDYWLEQLRGAPALLSLPADRPRPAIRSNQGAAHYLDLPTPLVHRLGEFNRANGVTMFMTMLAAFAGLLARYSGQDDLVVGTPVAGRTHPDLEPLIGFFVNTLALRITTTGTPSFRALVGRAREATLGGLSNAEVPFERLVEELQPERSLGHTPVFQAQLIMQNVPTTELTLAGTTATSLRVDSGTAKFDLSLVGEPTATGGLTLAVEYDTVLFDGETIARFGRHLAVLLEAGITDPDRPVAEIPLLTGMERWRAVVEWNATARGLPPVGSVLDLLPGGDPTSEPCPTGEPVPTGEPGPTGSGPGTAGEAVAVRGPDGTLDRDALARRARRLGRLLRARGVAPDTPVGLCLDRGAALLVGVLGVWRAGAGYLPLDPDLPADRLRYLLTDSGTRAVVTQRAVAERLGDVLAGVPTVVYLDDEAPEGSDEAPEVDRVEPVAPHPDGLAYLIYTSGSTGRPKGVAVPHRAVLNLVASFHDDLGLTPADRFAAVTTLSFDISVLELLVPLLGGVPLSIVDAAEAADGAALRRRLESEGITAMQATPATWRLLLAAGGVPDGLRLRLCGGEALPRDLADALLADGATLWNCYGPTETTVWSAASPVAPGPVDLGAPIANTELYLLDRAGQPVPVGVVGEVYIGGLGVVRGYHGRPGLTAARFVPDPFSGRPGARLYATGDLARQRADGRLEYLGRTDHQVKVRGHRIELGEIEEVLREHAAVADAVVHAWSADDGDTRLVGYLVPAPGAATDLPPVLRDWLAARLPGYLVPAALVPLPALPRNANGKVDRAALPPPDWRAAGGATHTAPRTPVEEVLAEIWAQVLGLDQVGVYDDFFALGGHSLLGTQALSRIGATFQLEVPIRVLFEAPTVAAMAAALTALEPEPGQAAMVAQLRREVAGMSTDDLRALLGEQS